MRTFYPFKTMPVAMSGAMLLLLTSTIIVPCADRMWAGAPQSQQKETKQKKVLNDLQGKWVLRSGEVGGKKFAGKEVTHLRIVIKGDKITSLREGKETLYRTFTIDAGKSPMHIDMTPTQEDGKQGNAIPGIFECDGKSLRICAGDGFQNRPTSFDTAGRPKLVLLTFGRE